MVDWIFEAWWEQEWPAAQALAAQSDILELEKVARIGDRCFIAHLRCRGLVRARDGAITEAEGCTFGIRIPHDYLRRVEGPEVLTWLAPANVFAPNIRFPFICAGHLLPGTPLTDLVYQVYEIWTYQKYTTHEGLNAQACEWALQPENRRRLPVDRRPLKRRSQA